MSSIMQHKTPHWECYTCAHNIKHNLPDMTVPCNAPTFHTKNQIPMTAKRYLKDIWKFLWHQGNKVSLTKNVVTLILIELSKVVTVDFLKQIMLIEKSIKIVIIYEAGSSL